MLPNHKKGMRLRILDKKELQDFLQGEAVKGKLILQLRFNEGSLNFSRELEDTYFTPNTPANKDFWVLLSPFEFFIIVPDTPMNRSAISLLSHKHERRFPPLTKFDEYMQLAYQVQTAEDHQKFRQKVFKDMFKFMVDHYNLKNVDSVAMLFLNEKGWKLLVKQFPNFKLASTAFSLLNCLIDEKGVIRPKNGCYIIFFRMEGFAKMRMQDMVYNFLLTVAHELLHFGGMKDEAKVHMLEFEVAEKFLGLHHTEEFKKQKLKEISEWK